ncbi:DUF4231 domain-containing protein [Nocardia sp. NPDC056952]|uniref:DUF4231 domain-containing protein n=1 Tax=Nocardia sp. NPDC056952 TaxID=3345979 RepID=UPI003634C0EA
MSTQIDTPVRPDHGDDDVAWERLTGQLTWYSTKAAAAQRVYKRIKLAQIVIGALLPVAALAAPAVITATIAAAVVAAEGALQLFQWQSNWIRYRATAEALKREKFLYLAKSGPYRDGGRKRALADRTEAIIAAETSSWVALYEEADESQK